MEPQEPFAPRENLLRLLDQLHRGLMEASLAREQGRLNHVRTLLRVITEVFEEVNTAMAAVSEATRKELMPLMLEASAAEALVHANAYAAGRTLSENRMHYAHAILVSQRIPDPAYQGRVLSSYGAVLLYFHEYAEAASELEHARQLLQSGEPGSWVQTTTVLAYAYLGLGRLGDAITMLHETISPFESLPYQPRPVTSHHIAAAMLLARLLVRNGQRTMAKTLLTRVQRRVRELDGLHATPEYRQLQVLRTIGFRRYESLQRQQPRTMLL